ncbi:sure-like protein [Westerdykella ornata]|uniref:Sure-like protein n=1 Tax=Westerdykella ornata TaxID=318751 RepID=A0A6A6JDV8_WESOR|nr:sure-like protein [Westerdykella ornata]KAF2274741.1 sure-like protein [Westerdykella ornata]
MRASTFIQVFLSLQAVSAIRIIQSNDDGWAEGNLRALFTTLVNAGHQVILSAPAENKSGSGSSDSQPTKVDSDGCAWNSCPPNSPPTGANSSDPRLNYVNSYPVTSIKYGIDTVAPKLWGANSKPELALTGPNVGSNVGLAVQFSGTVGAAVYAARTARIPAIAFSGASDTKSPWNDVSFAAKVYADLAFNVTNTIIAKGTPYLPEDVWLNVNFPDVSQTKCSNPSQFKYILTRINSGILSKRDVQWCGTDRLPTESDIIKKTGCYVAISVGDAADKTTVDAERQAVVLEKLRPLLTCV